MDLVKGADWFTENASWLAVILLCAGLAYVIASSRIWKRLTGGLEEALFSNWRLATLGATGVILSLASGWTTWDGMKNFTGEPLLSLMITFGIQGVMLIVAWLIGETFATGMSQRSAGPKRVGFSAGAQAIGGLAIGILLFAAISILFLGTGSSSLSKAFVGNDWDKIIDTAMIFAVGILLAALVALYSASDIVKPYLQSSRLILRNAVLWVMFLACMSTSVFFSFDSLFSRIFPAEERQRAAELRAQNQVAGIIADIGATMSTRQLAEAEALFRSEGWQEYELQLAALAQQAQGSTSEIEAYFVQQMEERRRGIAQQQERMATAESQQAGLVGRKTSLGEELARLTAERPGLAAEYTQQKTLLDEKAREVDAKRVEALAEEKGVEGSGRIGRGPLYRERMGELNRLQAEYKIMEERARSAEGRLAKVQLRIEQIRRELSTIDGDLAQLKGEAQTAQQRIAVAQQTSTQDEDAPRVDPARVLPAFERARTAFRQEPSVERLSALSQQCSALLGAMAATPATKEKVRGIDCDPKQAAEAAAVLFRLNDGIGVFAGQCAGGDRLNQQTSADALFGFARKCLADSGLPSADTDQLRTKINFIELNRDDKAHRFVVTWNAFTDGNRLAYLALAIAIAIDALVFMSGLFGANAVRSPLSDVPSDKARSAKQLESIIDTALIPHKFETARHVLGAMRPMTQRDGYMARILVDDHDPHAADIRRVLNAGTTIGAVRYADDSQQAYEVRAELFEYLSSVARREFEANKEHVSLAELERTVQVALLPDVGANAELVLSFMHPIREDRGFMAEVRLEEVEAHDYEHGRRDLRTVRSALNAGATYDRIQRVGTAATHYYVHGDFYKTLVRLRARLLGSVAHPALPPPMSGTRDGGKLDVPAEQIAAEKRAQLPDYTAKLNGNAAAHKAAASDPIPPTPALGDDDPAPAGSVPSFSPGTGDEGQDGASGDVQADQGSLDVHYWSELVNALGINPQLAVKRLSAPETEQQIAQAWNALHEFAKRNTRLSELLHDHQYDQNERLSEKYSELRRVVGGDKASLAALDEADANIAQRLPVLMLFPEHGLLDHLIESLEHAAQPDDGLLPGEQEMIDELRNIRYRLERADLDDSETWQWVGQALQKLAEEHRQHVAGQASGHGDKPH